MIGPEESIDAINARFGSHPRSRALHAKGNWCTGTFTAGPAARALSAAAHLRGEPVPVLARLSNGSGDPAEPDYAPDVRGLAVSFELPDGERTDLLAQTAPRFFSPTPDDFVAFLRANTGRSAVLKLPGYLLTNRKARSSLRANLPAVRPLASYAGARYFTVHAYRWVAADGSSRHTRCTWLPDEPERRIGLRDAKSRGRDYLREDLRRRLAADGVRFTLQAQIAAEGDDVDDPSNQWPEDRERVDVGTLELTGVADDPEDDGGVFVFDPTRVTAGVELSGDPVLLFRAAAYSASVERRLG